MKTFFYEVYMIDNIKHMLREIFLTNNKHTIRYGIAKGLRRIGGISFLPRNVKLSKEKTFLNSQTYNDQIIYDIGALEGLLTIFFANKVGPNGKIISFEPNPISYAMIKRNININNFNNVTLSHFAIGSGDDIADLEVPKYFRGHGSLLNKSTKNKITHKVKITSIDNLLQQKKYPTPDFIKLDIEGLELKALEGMKNLLINKKPKLFIEVHPFVENNMKRIIEFLEKYNYSIYHVEKGIEQFGSENLTIKGGHLFCE